MPIRPELPVPNITPADNFRALDEPSLPCVRRFNLRPTNDRNDQVSLQVSGNGFRVVSGAVGSDIVLPSSAGFPLGGGERDGTHPNAITGIANGEWYPVCFDRLDYIWIDDHGTTAPLRPLVIEVAQNGHVVEGVAGMGAGAFWEECLTRGNDVAIGNDAGGYVLYTDNPDSAGPFAQSAALNRRGRCHWHRDPYLSYRGTIDGGVGATDGVDWSIGFYQWDGTAMQLFRVLQESDLVFAGESSTGQMCISPAPIGGFEIRAVSDEAGTGGPGGTGAVSLSWAFGVRGGMRL